MNLDDQRSAMAFNVREADYRAFGYEPDYDKGPLDPSERYSGSSLLSARWLRLR
jgi:hypothetical protein